MNAMYIGSFDPFTLGHLSTVNKALKKHKQLIICVGKNDAKTPMFTTEERKKFIELAVANHPRAKDIIITTSDDLTVNIARQNNVNILIRGIRSDADVESEQPLAETIRFLAAQQGFKLKTDFFIQDDSFLKSISSSLVRNLLEMEEYTAAARCLPQLVAEEVISMKLKPLFRALCKSNDDYYWEKIKQAYSARPYHNLIHLAHMFDQLRIHNQNNKNRISNANLHLAIFLHDYVYDTSSEKIRPQHNERDSAGRAHQWYKHQIFIPDISTLTVYSLIMATAHTPNDDMSYEEQLIADLDLSILGTADPAT